MLDKKLVPGAGAFEIAAHDDLMKYKTEVSGKAKLGVQAFADAMLIIPKTLAANSGFDQMESILTLQDELHLRKGVGYVGLDINSGEAIDATVMGIYDAFAVKIQAVETSGVIACQVLCVDEIIRAGRATFKPSMQI